MEETITNNSDFIGRILNLEVDGRILKVKVIGDNIQSIDNEINTAFHDELSELDQATKNKGTREQESALDASGIVPGYLYAMSIPSFGSDVYKIGRTVNITERLRSYTTGYFEDPVISAQTNLLKDCVLAEKSVHHILKDYRIRADREFFRCTIDLVIEAFEKAEKENSKYNLSNDLYDQMLEHQTPYDVAWLIYQRHPELDWSTKKRDGIKCINWIEMTAINELNNIIGNEPQNIMKRMKVDKYLAKVKSLSFRRNIMRELDHRYAEEKCKKTDNNDYQAFVDQFIVVASRNDYILAKKIKNLCISWAGDRSFNILTKQNVKKGLEKILGRESRFRIDNKIIRGWRGYKIIDTENKE